MSQSRIWIGLLDRQMYVQVQIDTNDVFYGYPAVAANGSRDALPNTEGVFIPGGRIRMIQFLLPGQVIPIAAGPDPRPGPPAATTP